MKLKYIFSVIVILCIVFYFIDREVYMKKRVLRHDLWEHDEGDKIIDGDIISTHDIIIFRGDTMICAYEKSMRCDTFLLEWQYFNLMRVKNLKNGKVGIYTMKGANWINFL